MTVPSTPGFGVATLLPKSLLVIVKGEPFEVRQLRVRQLDPVIKAVAPLYASVQAAKGDTASIDVASMLTHSLGDVVQLIAAATEQSEEWVGDLEVDEMADVLFAVLEVNMSFFIKKLLPGLVAKIVPLVAVLKTHKDTPEPISNA